MPRHPRRWHPVIASRFPLHPPLPPSLRPVARRAWPLASWDCTAHAAWAGRNRFAVVARAGHRLRLLLAPASCPSIWGNRGGGGIPPPPTPSPRRNGGQKGGPVCATGPICPNYAALSICGEYNFRMFKLRRSRLSRTQYLTQALDIVSVKARALLVSTGFRYIRRKCKSVACSGCLLGLSPARFTQLAQHSLIRLAGHALYALLAHASCMCARAAARMHTYAHKAM